jgi:hypothetical protein
MHEFSIDKEPLSTDELKSEIAHSDARIAKLSRLFPFFVALMFTGCVSVFLTFVFTVGLCFAPSIIGVFMNHAWISPAPYFLTSILIFFVYKQIFFIDGLDYEIKRSQERCYRESLNDASQIDCIEIVEWLKHPEISSYRDKVVAQARVFIDAEVEMLGEFHDSFAAKEACKKVYVENLTSRPDAEPKVIPA